MNAIESQRRAEAFDDEVPQQPLFGGFHISFDLSELRILIRVCGDGKIGQGKRKSIPRGLQERFFTRPARKETCHAELFRQGVKFGALAKGEESFGERTGIDMASDPFEVDTQPVITANCDQSHISGVRYVELQRTRILVGCELRFTTGVILKTYLGGRNCQVVSKQAPKRSPASGESNPVLVEVEAAGASDFIDG